MNLPAASYTSARFLARLCAIAGFLAIAACTTKPVAPPPPPPPPPESGPPATNPITSNQPEFLNLPNISADQTPLRVGIILPFSNTSAGVKALAQSLMKSAELALFDSGKPNIILMSADEGNTPADAAAAANKLLGQGAEVIIGPVFAASVSAVAPIAHDRAVPVIAFSSDRTVGGKGVYLLSFQPEAEVQRIIAYAASQGKKNFAAMIPENAYGDHVNKVFEDDVKGAGGTVAQVQHFEPKPESVSAPAKAIAGSGADAVLIAQGGVVLRAIAPTLASDGMTPDKVKYLGTGVWLDETIGKEPMMDGGWFAAPAPGSDAAFVSKYRNNFGDAPPKLAALAYDALSLVAALSDGKPYERFTQQALTNPNGFTGVDGIFRFNNDGGAERGLAILGVTPDGFTVIAPAPATFQPQGS